MDPIQGLDWGTYYWFRTQRSLEIAALEQPMAVFNNLGSLLFLGILALLVFLALLRAGHRRAALSFLVSVATAWVAAVALRSLVARPRPVDAEAAGILSFGFPSESAMLSSLIFGVLALVLSRGLARKGAQVAASVVPVLFILAIGASQMYFGYQFLTDVLAGWAGGTLLLLVGDRLSWYSAGRIV